MKTGRPKGPEKKMWRKRLTEEEIEKVEGILRGVIEHKNSESEHKKSEEDRELREELKAKDAEIYRLRAQQVIRPENPSLQQAENEGLKKRISELEQAVKNWRGIADESCAKAADLEDRFARMQNMGEQDFLVWQMENDRTNQYQKYRKLSEGLDQERKDKPEHFDQENK